MARNSLVRLVPTIALLMLAAGNVGAAAAPATPPAVPAAASFSAEVPSVEAIGSNISTDTLKAILGGDIAGHADALAHLTATSIRVPSITLHFKSSEAGGAAFDYVYRDIDLEAVTDGVAKTVSFGEGEGSSAPGGAKLVLGKASMEQVDIGGLLAFYGLVKSAPGQPPRTLYRHFSAAGAKFSGKDFNCDVGAIAADEFKGRPLKLSFADLLALVGSPEFKTGGKPSPEAMGKLISFYIDFFDAFETSPMQLDSLDCSGKDDKGKAVAVSMGPLTIGSFGHRRYPAIDVKNLKVAAADGQISLDDFTFKSFDLSGPFKLLESASSELSEAWFTANARKLIPAFEGASLANLKIDVPNEQNPGERVKADIGSFDLSLGDYFEGIPTNIAVAAHHVAIDVPSPVAGSPDQYEGLRQLGISALDLGFDFAQHRDAASKTIVVDKLALSGEQMGGVTLSTTLGNADDALFSSDQDTAMAAAMAVTVKTARLEVIDAGLADLVLKRVGTEQGMDLPTARARLSGMAQGLVLVGLGGTPAAKALGDAVGKFIAGGKSLTVTATAKAAGGLTLTDFAAAKADPKTLVDKLTIDAAEE